MKMTPVSQRKNIWEKEPWYLVEDKAMEKKLQIEKERLEKEKNLKENLKK